MKIRSTKEKIFNILKKKMIINIIFLMKFTPFEIYLFKKLIFIGNFSFLLFFMRKTIFLFYPNLTLSSNCITSRTVNQNIKINNCLIKKIIELTNKSN